MKVGDRCQIVNSTRRGHIAFIGPVEGLPEGDWVGIHLDHALGKHDGTVRGRRYFQCPAQHGVLVRKTAVQVGEYDLIPMSEVVQSISNVAHDQEAVKKRFEQRLSAARGEARSGISSTTLSSVRCREEAAQKDPSESVSSFWQKFNSDQHAIRDGIESVREHHSEGTAHVTQLSADLDSLALSTNSLRDLVADASFYLPPYDVRQAQNVTQELTAEIEKTRVSCVPRKKFSFRNRRKLKGADPENKDISISVQTPIPTPVTVKPEPTLVQNQSHHIDTEVEYKDLKDTLLVFHSLEDSSSLDELRVTNLRTETVFLDSNAKSRHDLSFSNLSGCIVCILTTVHAIRANSLRSCSVFTGVVAGSVLLHDCCEGQFHMAPRQVRIHSTVKTDFYLLVPSNPIIEDCNELRFAPYEWTFDGLEDQLRAQHRERSANLWSKVNDFKWHRTQQSPHWSILPEEQRILCTEEGLHSLIKRVL